MITQSRWSTWLSLLGTLFVLPILAALLLDRAASAAPARTARFFDVPSQAAEFIGYNRSIALTGAQRKVRDKALSEIPAPCCDKFTAATCCCPCNLAKTIWGLSNAMIVRDHASAAQVQTAVRDWLKFINSKGYTGDVCDSSGGCSRNFSDDGCGGMDESNLLAAR